MSANEILIDLTGVTKTLFDRLLGNFMENETFYRNFWIEHLKKVPADRLPLSIFVGCEVDFGSVLYSFLELVDPLLLIAGDNIEGGKVAIDVNSKTGPLLLFYLRWNLSGVIW